MQRKNRRLAVAVSAAMGFGSMVAATQTIAQETGVPQQARQVDEIVVTGSLIRRPDFVSNSPIATVDAEQFSLSGTINTENLLNSMPQTIPGFDSSSNNPGNGTATVDLRGLGTTRTLVLMDGVRIPPSTLGGVVDLNNVPPSLIERVEVVTGGASAVYGSDAIAGVVNFIMKQDFEGIEISGGRQFTQKNDAEIDNVNITFGGNFDDGRGNAVFSMGYTDRRALQSGERGFSRVALIDDGNQLAPGGSSLIPELGLFGAFPEDLTPSGGIKFDGQGGFTPFITSGPNNDLYNYAPDNYLQLPQERFTISSFGRYELADNIELYGRGTFAASRVNQQLAPSVLVNNLNFTIDGNPFLNPQTQQVLSDAFGAVDPETDELINDTTGNGISDTGSAVFLRRMPETGPRAVNDNRNTYQLMFGARGELTANWDYDIYFSEGRFENSTTQTGNINVPRFEQGLLLDVSDPDNITCQNTGGGCVPVNAWGANQLSEEAAEFVAVRVNTATDITQRVFSAMVTGDSGAFELPGGPIGMAVGYEFIFNRGDFRPSEDIATGAAQGFNPAPPVSGQFHANSFYGEIYAPILRNAPFAEVLAIEAAYRTSDYTTAGRVNAWKIAGEWAPIEDVRFRTSFNTAVRAPSLTDLFSPQSLASPSAEDPCGSNALAAGGFDVEQRRQLCIATGVPESAVFTSGINAAAGQIRGLFGGNPDLQEEEADTFTLGVVYQPRQVDGLSVSVDYFNIELTDRIDSFGGGVASILNICYNDQQAGGVGSPFCNAIERFDNGFIEFVEATNQNIADSKLEGIDLQVDYGFDTRFGSIDLGYLGTWINENSRLPFPGADRIECGNRFGQECGTPDPSYRHRARMRWSNDTNLTAQLIWEYIGSSKDDTNDPNAFAVTSLGSASYFDGSISWTITDQYNATFGINNILDKSPPILGNNDQQSNTFPNTYDPYGRSFFINLRAQF